ncbi:biopolymer transporter ExbD [Roseibacterium sp. SDUM158017]|uniref:biopolymer transporter ExbD n=1 Tax=Roseicyclus salinarum TaxID=3036773 RepID=UPI0024154D4E|nr:biopolymer transporter ExbD [Roseibacterium sp. SDUM158017]MDG4649653.1 biopolymer transporter ExbD [Roseibacterium sp. SDUM158017]
MALERTTWRRRPVTLTPLIDVIFLLLLFFMLSSTFTRFAEVPLVNAGAGGAQGTAPLFLRLGAEGLSLNGDAHSLETLAGALVPLAPEGDAPRTILVTLDDRVTSQRLVDLLVVLRAMPWLAVSVLE